MTPKPPRPPQRYTIDEMNRLEGAILGEVTYRKANETERLFAIVGSDIYILREEPTPHYELIERHDWLREELLTSCARKSAEHSPIECLECDGTDNHCSNGRFEAT